MPPQSHIGALCNLLQGFLDLVLAKVNLPRVGGGADGVDRVGLGYGDQPDLVRPAPGAAGGVRDPVANLRQPARDVLVHAWLLTLAGHFFSCAIMPLACAAY
jgi:hypothetical protein